MNPVTAIRSLVESYAEGSRVKKFGFDYREKAQAEGLANQQAALEVADLPGKLEQARKISQITIDTDTESHATLAAAARAAGYDATPAGLARYSADLAKQDRDLKNAETSAQTAHAVAATTATNEASPNARPALSDVSLNVLHVPQGGPNGPNPLPTNADIGILKTKMEEEARLKQAVAAATLRVQGQQSARANKRTPLQDDNGNFTGKLIDANGNLSTNPELAGLRGKPLTGQVASRVNQAGVVMDTADLLLDNMGAVKDKLGPIMGRGFRLEQMWGNPDPDINKFAVELASFAALQPALHGFRGQAALREFQNMIGGANMTPEALVGAIQGIKEVGGIIQRSGGPNPTGHGAVPPPTGGAGAGAGGATAESYLSKWK